MDQERVPLLEASSSQSQADGLNNKTKKPSTLRTVCPYILGNELCERFAYNGLATNLVTYITRVMGGEPAFAAIMVAVFEGTCYNTPIIGALLADSVWGRYKTIMVFSFIYLVGIVLLTLSSTIPDADEDADSANPLQYGVLFASLAVISLGTGGIKPNVSAFGADQFNEADPQDRKEKESFFNWFYLAINVGSLLAGTVIVYIQDSVSWTLGFAIPGVAMAMAIVLFWAGRAGYRHVMPTESPMTRVARVVWAAIKNKYSKKSTPDSSTHQYVVPSASSPPETSSYHGAQLYRQALQNQAFNNGMDNNGLGPNVGNGQGMIRADSMHQMPMTQSMSYRWLEDAVTEWRTSQGQLVTTGGLAGYTPKQVEEVKLVIRLLPIFGTTVLYWTVYTQMGTLFVQQGGLMARHYDWGGQTFKVPAASMSVFNTLSVILLVWWYDAWLEPTLKRYPRFKITLLRRQGWGMLIAAFAMIYAGGLEAWRLSTLAGIPPCPSTVTCNAMPPDFKGSAADGSSMLSPFGGMGSATRQLLYSAGSAGSDVLTQGWAAGDILGRPEACLCPNDPSPLSIFWQAPAYFLIGLSEVFTSIGQLEFFYDQAPDVMRSCSMALCLLSTAIGSYLAGALTYAVQKFSMMVTGCEWLPRDLNRGHIDFFFYSLACVMMANLFAFLYVAMRYQYKAVEHKRHVLQPAAQQVATQAAGPGPTRSQASAPAQLLSAAWPMPHPPGTAPMTIGRPNVGQGQPPEDLDAAGLEVYSRSLAYVPPSPNIPAPFR